VTSNVLGTKNAVGLADEYGTQHFIHLSTVNAVRPRSVLGVSKRVAELVVQSVGAGGERGFASVRLCNVLGSRSSVMPTFLNQVRAGGPVTVTHRDMWRHFVLLPDAAALVLEAAALAGGDGDLLALDVGTPVRILDLASVLVRAHRQERGRDIEIRFTGIRPGERLDEEILQDFGSAEPTRHPKIRRVTSGRPAPDIGRVVDRLIESAGEGRDDEELRVLLTLLVPDFVPEAAAVPRRPPTARVHVA
jgi:FlaA1/EpsC-like NDP-sugar epimerase